ncbi:MAG: 4Fe-4S dicluster domain-containing protein [Deltaproteobacteria bacterium]|nr:4Fe-4S dicluster domain-containing protein [Deltaproteobacteria bacterium]
MPSVTVLAESCKGVEDCGLCMEVCPEELFAPSNAANSRGYLPSINSNEAACTGCESCMRICPDFAVIVKKKSAKEKETDHG